jgi:hypothetical protein
MMSLWWHMMLWSG